MPTSSDNGKSTPTPRVDAGSQTEPRKLLRLIPLDDTVVFPNMGITLTVDVGDDERVVLVPRHENEFLEVGTVAEVEDHIRLPGGGRAVALSGQHRAQIGAAQTGPTATCAWRCRRPPTGCPPMGAPATWSASTARSSRRSSSCAATTGGSRRSCARSSSPARWPTPPATPPICHTRRRSSCCARSTSPTAWSWR